MKLYLVRHGQSTNNAGLPRVLDAPLTPLGEEQARYAAQALRREGLTHLYSSSMRRAMQTAAAISETTGLPIHVVQDFCEAEGLCQLPGITRAELEALFPSWRLAESVTDACWRPGPEESLAQAYERACRMAQALRNHHFTSAPPLTKFERNPPPLPSEFKGESTTLAHPDRDADGSVENRTSAPEIRMALVIHGTFASFLIRALLDIPLRGQGNERHVRFSHANGAISLFEIEDEIVRIHYLNRTDHLPSEKATGHNDAQI